MKVPSTLIAVIDIGSNNFRLMLMRVDSAMRIQPVQRLRETVRLAAGLSSDNVLTQAAIMRGLNALRQFHLFLGKSKPEKIYAVATHALRRANNAQDFLSQAEDILGCPITVITGQEEARLTYLGVICQTMTAHQTKNLVIDIGGGSTELIIGCGQTPQLMESIEIGCISHTLTYFSSGNITADAMLQAERAVQQMLHPFLEKYRQMNWTRAIASSGTACALAEVLIANSFIKQANCIVDKNITGVIDYGGLIQLKKQMIALGRVEKLKFHGLSGDRSAVFIGGVAIMLGLLNALEIETIETVGDVLAFGVIFAWYFQSFPSDAASICA